MKPLLKEERNAHYQEMEIQPIEVMDAWLTDEQMFGYCLGNVIKYLGRYNTKAEGKGGLRDLKKAKDYLHYAILCIESTDA